VQAISFSLWIKHVRNEGLLEMKPLTGRFWAPLVRS